MDSAEITVREIEPSDRDWVRSFLREHFGSTKVVSRNVVHQADDLPGFIALYRGEPSALLTYCVKHAELEVVSLHAASAGRGLGSHLLASVRQRARDLRCRRLWLITTNDNEPAIAFYTRWGMHLAAVVRSSAQCRYSLVRESPRVGAPTCRAPNAFRSGTRNGHTGPLLIGRCVRARARR